MAHIVELDGIAPTIESAAAEYQQYRERYLNMSRVTVENVSGT
jgi:hypothetical protein